MEDNITIALPKLGESILSATVVQWFKKIGDRVERDEALLEVSTDKVNSEIPSPVAGILQAILAEPDQEVQVGEPLGVIVLKGTVSGSASPAAPVVSCAKAETHCPEANHNSTLSPAVLRLLHEKKIPLTEIDRIPHTGT